MAETLEEASASVFLIVVFLNMGLPNSLVVAEHKSFSDNPPGNTVSLSPPSTRSKVMVEGRGTLFVQLLFQSLQPRPQHQNEGS